MLAYREYLGQADDVPGKGGYIKVTIEIPGGQGGPGEYEVGRDGVVVVHASGSAHDPLLSRFGYATSGTVLVRPVEGGLAVWCDLQLDLPGPQEWLGPRLVMPEENLKLNPTPSQRP
jgi:hypothetical protein